MTPSSRAIVWRYWRDRANDAFRDDEAALYAVGLGLDVGLRRVEEATAGPVAVLLGPPGSGKTTELKRLAEVAPETSRLISLGSTGSEDRLQAKIGAAVTAISGVAAVGERGPVLMLDSLDESRLRTTELAGFFYDLLPELPKHLRLVIACRSAAWLPGVESALQQHYQQVPIYDLAPLTTADVEAYAGSAGVDGATFFQAVRQAKALPLATSPNTLGLLLDEYLAGGQSSGALPPTQRDLYDRSCFRLVREPNPARQSPRQPADAPRSIATVGHLAVLSLFSGRDSFVFVGEGGDDDLSVDDCRPAAVSPHGGTDELAPTPDLIAQSFDTAIFTGAGDRRVRFAHQTLAEYLAARHLLTTGMSNQQLDGLLRGRGGLLAPQVQAVAAWLITLAPARFANLLRDDPAAFVQSSVELNDPEYRRGLVAGLLNLAGQSELPDFWGINLHGLAYDGIDQRVGAVLTDGGSSIDARYMALQIVRANRLTNLLDAVVALALNHEEPVPLRNAAGHAVLDLGSLHYIEALAVLADGGSAEDDPNDELFGLGLLSLLQSGTSPATLLPRLRGERNTDLFGSYRMFLMSDLPAALRMPTLSRDDLLAALVWAKDVEAAANRDQAMATGLLGHADELFDAILIAGLERLAEPDVIPAVARLIAVRVNGHYQITRERRTELPTVSDEPRRRLLDALQGELGSPHDVWMLHRSPLLTSNDLSWAAERAAHSTSDDDRAILISLIRVTYDRSRTDHRAALEGLLAAAPDCAESLDYLLEPPQPPPLAEVTVEDGDETAESPPTDDDIRHRLIECLSLDDDKSFSYWCHWAQFAGGERYSHRQLELDVRELPGWSLLSTSQQQQVVSLAERYLQAAEPEVAALLGTDQYNTGAFAGARALVLLAELGVAVNLPEERWQFWAPALVRGPFSSPEDLLSRPFRQVLTKAPDALLAAAEREIRGKPEHGQFTLRRLTPALTAEAVPWLRQVIDDTSFDDATASVAFERLLSLDQPIALELLAAELLEATATSASLSGRLQQLLVVALHAAPAITWTLGYPALSSDEALAGEVIGSLAHSMTFDATGLIENEVVQLWRLIDRLFPVTGDPDVRGAHAVSVRESIGHFRERLLPALAERGTVAAVTALRQLADEYPAVPSFRRIAARAQATLRRSDWTPLRPSEILEALASAKRVLRGDADLLEAVLDALSQVQGRLQGATPAATLLWNHVSGCQSKSDVSCSPKSEDEISDFLRDEIERLVPGAVVNREVQVSRLKTSGIGQRTDLLIEVPASADSSRILRVIIEVKGCWNDDIPTALDDQLVSQYLLKWPGSAGVFLVVWFDPAHGWKGSTWLKDPVRNNLSALHASLVERAEAASSSSGHYVRSVVIDSSMPAK